MNIDFSGKVVVVTGAGGVLCGTMAKAFAQAVRKTYYEIYSDFCGKSGGVWNDGIWQEN